MKNKYVVCGFFILALVLFTACPPVSQTPEVTKVDAAKPTISIQPQSQSVLQNAAITLAVKAAVSDGGTLSYQWYSSSIQSYENPVGMMGANGSSYSPPTNSHGTIYWFCEITNTNIYASGKKEQKIFSDFAKITVTATNDATVPTISVQPQSQSVLQNAAITLTVAASVSDGGTLSYQWYSNSADNYEGSALIAAATASSYSPPTATLGTLYYYCEITNTNNAATGNKTANLRSERAKITVRVPGIQPVDLNGAAAGLGWDTASWELGSKKNGSLIEFAVYSKNASRIVLEIYKAAYGEDAIAYFIMEKASDNIWRAKIDISEITLNTVYYAFRVWGANWTYNAEWARGGSDKGFVSDCDADGNRFNPNKVLFDPYTKELSHDKSNQAALAGKTIDIYTSGDANRNFDTGKYTPKSIVLENSGPVTGLKNIAQKDAIVYEVHVRGFTQHESSSNLSTILSGFAGFESAANIPSDKRGTYAGAAMMAPYLKALGINTVELLPIHESDNDGNPANAAGGNFWGYMTYGFFAPERRYSSDKTPGGPTNEFKEMINTFHANGIEVYLDVVYNHSGEGGTWTLTGGGAEDPSKTEISFLRGFDNSEYYCLNQSDKTKYWVTTGCGNNTRCDNPPMQKMILDSLKYWTEEMGVDGFRFDLGPVLGRVQNGNDWNFQSGAKLLTDISAYAQGQNIEIIAESWDIHNVDGYQVGNYPSGWAEWNGRYRDRARRFLNSGSTAVNNANEMSYADAFNGDYDHFNDQGGACKSLNFITAHDGFTMTDLVSYDTKQNNGAWPFGPSDGGTDGNDSTNSDNNPALRRQRFRNAMTFLLFSRGVPMIVYGDEFGRTQNGNNNPYNIDGLATYNNYNMINTDSPNAIAGGYHNNLGTDSKADTKNAIFEFVRHLINVRKNENALRQAGYEMPIDFSKADGTSGFNSTIDRACRAHINGSLASGGGSDYVVCINMADIDVNFTLPAPASGKKWVRIIDTASWAETDSNFWFDAGAAVQNHANPYGVKAWAITVFKEITQ